MASDFMVTVSGRRASIFNQVFGTNTVAVTSPSPILATLPGFLRPHPVYMLDLDAITPGQRYRQVEHLSERFYIPAEEIERDLDSHGMPILAEDCTVAIANPERRAGRMTQ